MLVFSKQSYPRQCFRFSVSGLATVSGNTQKTKTLMGPTDIEVKIMHFDIQRNMSPITPGS